MALREILEDISIGAIGTGLGILAGEILGEFFARVTGQVGARKVVVKGLTKGLVSLAIAAAAERVRREPYRTIAKAASYSPLGSVSLDIAEKIYPGGARGVAERLALSARVAASHAPSVVSQAEARVVPGPTAVPRVVKRVETAPAASEPNIF